MIALLLIAQISAAAPVSPTVPSFFAAAPRRSSEMIRLLPGRVACKNDVGRMEVGYAQPTALYLPGDRPAKGLRKWADYPDGTLCAVGFARSSQ